MNRREFGPVAVRQVHEDASHVNRVEGTLDELPCLS